MTNRDRIINELIHLRKETINKYKFDIIGLFGSYARGTEKESSDIDVLVRPLKGADLFSFGGLSVFLERKFGRKVDVVPERNIRKELKDAILSEVIRI